MSNKVTGGFTLYRDPSLDLDMDLSTITMDTLFATMPSNTIMVAGLDSGWNKDIAPAATGTLIAVSRYQGRKFAIFNTAGLSDLWIGSMGSSFSGWKPFAMAEPPQEYTLQAQSGLTANVQYSRSQEGIVVLYADARKSDSSALGASAITVGTLPVGFRPASIVYASAVALDSSAGAILGAAQIWVSQTGVISMIADPQSGAHRMRGELVFPVG